MLSDFSNICIKFHIDFSWLTKDSKFGKIQGLIAAEYRSPRYNTVTFAPAFSNSKAASTAEFLPQ